MAVENCIVCKRKTYGSVCCSLKHFQVYINNKSRFRKKKAVKEILESSTERRVEALKEANEMRAKNRIEASKAAKPKSFWQFQHDKSSE